MDGDEIYRMLKVPPAGVLIADVKITRWGQQVVLDCLYDPVEQHPFQLIFTRCQDIGWQVVDDRADERDVTADVIDLRLGENDYRQPAALVTDIFELSILYGALKVRKSW